MEPTPVIDRLASRRQEFESRFSNLRQALDREIGWAPKARTWALPLAAFAAGLVLAARLVARRKGDEQVATLDEESSSP